MTPPVWLCSLHAKLSLILAFLPYPRLWFFQKKLEKDWKESWGYKAPLPHGDTIEFFPYSVAVEGIDIKINKTRSYIELRKRTVLDPINIIAYNLTPIEFLKILIRSKVKWQTVLGSVHFLHTPFGWSPSVAAQVPLDQPGERYHVRLFSGVSARAMPVTFGAAHHDFRDERGRHITPPSWNEVRDLIGESVVADYPFQYLISKPATQPNFRDAEGDGKIRVIIMQ